MSLAVSAIMCSWSRLFGWLLLGFMPLLMQACASPIVPVTGRTEAYVQRQANLQNLQQWTLSGRVAIANGEQGGSGRLQWQHSLSSDAMSFNGALGRGAWTLDSGPDKAEISFANGDQFTAASLSALVTEQVGWPVPVEALRHWVLGLDDPRMSLDGITTGSDGEPLLLLQDGWEITFQRYTEVANLLLPNKLVARKNGHHVKLIIRNWEFL